MDDLDERQPPAGPSNPPDEAGAGKRKTWLRLYNGKGDRCLRGGLPHDLTGIHLADAMQALIEHALPRHGWATLRLLLREAHRLEVDVMPSDDAFLLSEDVTRLGSWHVYHVDADMRDEALRMLDELAAVLPDGVDEPDFMDGPEPDPGAKSAASVTSVGSIEPGDESEAYADDPATDEKLF